MAELRGYLTSFIVGRQYHPSVSITGGDALSIQREPQNQYDKNAIVVLKNGTPAGYVPKKFAAIISPYIDDKTMHINTGIVSENYVAASPELQAADCVPIYIKITWDSSNKREHTLMSFRAMRIPVVKSIGQPTDTFW